MADVIGKLVPFLAGVNRFNAHCTVSPQYDLRLGGHLAGDVTHLNYGFHLIVE